MPAAVSTAPNEGAKKGQYFLEFMRTHEHVLVSFLFVLLKDETLQQAVECLSRVVINGQKKKKKK